MQALVISRLNYRNVLLVRLPQCRINNRLQKVHNRAARLVKRAGRFCNDFYSMSVSCIVSYTDSQVPVQQKVKFKILLHVFKALNNLAPRYCILQT